MRSIHREVLDAAVKLNIKVHILNDEESAGIRQRLLASFAPTCSRWPTWIWEHLEKAEYFEDKNGWQWVGSYTGFTETIMLFSDRDDINMVAFPDGNSVGLVLAECFGFEFYLTNRSIDFLLCFNHHDCVVATGEAAKWLMHRKHCGVPKGPG